MVGSFYFVMHSGLAGIAGRNKPLINMKAHLQRCAFCFTFIWFRVQGSGFRALVAASLPFLLGHARKWYFSHGLPVITTIRAGPWRRKSRRGTSEFGLIQRGTTLRSGMKNDMRRSVFLACHEGRSRGILLAER